jgi:hypothetical protein
MTMRIGACLLVTTMTLTGCKAKVLGPSPNDALRQQVQDLEGERDALRLSNEQLQAQLAAREPSGQVTPELEQATPRPARIEVEGLSRVLVQSPSGPIELAVYVKAVDGRGREVQLTGALSLTATLQMPDGVVSRLAHRTWRPGELVEMHRSGLTGTHYTIKLPVEGPLGQPGGLVSVVLTYTDGWTGRQLQASSSLPWPAGPGHD